MLRRHVLSAERLHGDDTTVPVLAAGKTIIGRLWTYVRDDRPFGGLSPPATMFFYSRDRGGGHPCRHLVPYHGILQADAYAGFNDPAGAQARSDRRGGVLDKTAQGSMRVAHGMAGEGHGRRKLFVLADVAKSPLAIEAVRRIDAILDVEHAINLLSAEHRRAVRQARVAPLVASLEDWMRGERSKLSRHADVVKAMDYMLNRWEAFSRFLGDGRICLTNNAAERAA